MCVCGVYNRHVISTPKTPMKSGYEKKKFRRLILPFRQGMIEKVGFSTKKKSKRNIGIRRSLLFRVFAFKKIRLDANEGENEIFEERRRKKKTNFYLPKAEWNGVLMLGAAPLGLASMLGITPGWLVNPLMFPPPP